MSNADIRKAHKLLDYVSQGRAVLDDELKLLRSFLPDLPKQKTLAELTHDVYEAWAYVDGNDWSNYVFGELKTWLDELHTQLKGLEASAPARPEFLETEADYASAPRGTVAAKDGWLAWLKETEGYWSCGGSSDRESDLARSGKRRVLRWGWTNEQLCPRR